MARSGLEQLFVMNRHAHPMPESSGLYSTCPVVDQMRNETTFVASGESLRRCWSEAISDGVRLGLVASVCSSGATKLST